MDYFLYLKNSNQICFFDFFTKNIFNFILEFGLYELKVYFCPKFSTMDLTKILSISGKPGLYKLVGEAKNNLVVESIPDGKKFPAFPHEHISSLKEISIYTTSGDAPLQDVLKKIYEIQKGEAVASPKKMNATELKTLFEKVLPDYDQDAVYVSDIKKVFNWYNVLLSGNLLDFEEENQEVETAPKEEE